MSTREEIQGAFKKALRRLQRVPNVSYAYICHQLTNFGNEHDSGTQAAMHVIHSRLGKHYTLEDWLNAEAGIPRKELTAPRMHKYRVRWVKELIREFS